MCSILVSGFINVWLRLRTFPQPMEGNLYGNITNVLTGVAVRTGVAGSTRTRVGVDTVVTRSAILTYTRTAVVNVCQQAKSHEVKQYILKIL